MNFFQRIGSWMMGGEAKNAAAMVSAWQNHQPVYGEVNYNALARRGYRRNELVFACVNYRAQSAATTALRLYDRRNVEIADHPARQLLQQPNPLMTEFDFWQWTIGMSDLGGAAYWLKERSRNGRVIGLWPMRTDCVTPIANTATGIEAYQYTINGTDDTYPANDVIAFTNFDPLNAFNGWSPAQVAGRLIDVDNNTTDYLKIFFQNSAMVRGVLKVKNKLDDSQAARLRAKWRELYGGVSNWGDVAVLDSDAEYLQMGSSFKDMDFGNLDARIEARICMVFGIPPILIGAKVGLDRSTFSNYSEARLSFWQDTMMPIYKHLADEFALGMRDEFGDSPIAMFDMSNVPALIELRIARLKAAQDSWQNGVMTRNEARALAQLPAAQGGNMFIDAPETLAANTTSAPAGKKSAMIGNATEHKKKHAYKRDLIARAFELRFREAAQAVFAEESRIVLKALGNGKKAADTDWGGIGRAIELALEAGKDEWRKAFAPLIQLILSDTIDQISADFGIAFDVNNPFVQVFIDTYVPKFADMVVSSTRNALVTDMLQKAQDEGLSIPDLARLIRGKYEQWDATRSTVIARTETIRSSNAGALAAIRDVGIDKKQWLATNDTRTRPDHRHADGQIVGVDEAFVVGGEKLQYPGDPDASAKQTIQCRCTVIPIVDGLEQPVSPQAAEPQSYKPGDGAKVSAALANTAKGSTKKEIDLAIKLLDAVHADGDLPEIPIGQNASKSSYGVYTRSLYDVAKDIKISSLGDHKRLTTWHEIGHFIDHKGLPGAGFTTQNAGNELTKAWFDAVQNSKAAKTLAGLKYKTELVYKTEDGKEIAMRVNRQYVSYSISAIEFWARSYAQYIATKSKDTEILEWIEDQARSVYPTQWEQDDFAPILAAIDGMFLKLGWIK